jgi:hypothetical protein
MNGAAIIIVRAIRPFNAMLRLVVFPILNS